MSSLERLWYETTLQARLARAVLTPPALLFETIVRVRSAMYDRGLLRTHASRLPVLSLGNLTVGGTGKTPMAAWTAGRLRAAGAHPAILLRGYGDDETLVHAALSPGVSVIANPDRVAGVLQAHAAGADCVVLDDGFQHRRLARAADWVLVAAEQFASSQRMLPAGPLREPMSALARAEIAIVTRKSASADDAADVARRLGAIAPSVAIAVCHLAPTGIVNALDHAQATLELLRGQRVVAVAGIGAPNAFFAQLDRVGVAELRRETFADHHRYSANDVERLMRVARGADLVVCTLKDAVKLAPLWAHVSMPLWYVSQRAEVESGLQHLDASLAAILSERADILITAGAAG